MRVFSGCTVNPGTCTGPTHTCCLCWATAARIVIGQLLWGGVITEAMRQVIYFSTHFVFLFLHIFACGHC